VRILAVDDESIGLKALKQAIEEAAPEAEIAAIGDFDDAVSYVSNNKVDIAFLDIFLGKRSGIELAKQIKIISYSTQIVFATGYDDYMKDAFQLHASGYILKPITAAKVREELSNITSVRNTIYEELSQKSGKRVKFQCFGNFEVFCDGVPLHFRYDKTKEMLGYVVTKRGSLCSNGEILANLWEDDNDHDSYLRAMRKDLVDILKAKDIENAIYLQRGKIGVNVSEVSCDYYDFLDGDVAALNKYRGEFMHQYNWGEFLTSEFMDI